MWRKVRRERKGIKEEGEKEAWRVREANGEGGVEGKGRKQGGKRERKEGEDGEREDGKQGEDGETKGGRTGRRKDWSKRRDRME